MKVSGHLYDPQPPETIPVPIEQDAGWASEPIWTLEKRNTSCVLEFKLRIAQPILLSLYLLRYPVMRLPPAQKSYEKMHFIVLWKVTRDCTS